MLQLLNQWSVYTALTSLFLLFTKVTMNPSSLLHLVAIYGHDTSKERGTLLMPCQRWISLCFNPGQLRWSRVSMGSLYLALPPVSQFPSCRFTGGEVKKFRGFPSRTPGQRGCDVTPGACRDLVRETTSCHPAVFPVLMLSRRQIIPTSHCFSRH